LTSTDRIGAVSPGSAGERASGEANSAWLACLQEVCGLLWPAPAVVGLEGSRGWRGLGRGGVRWARSAMRPEDGEFALVPGVRRPPLLVPAARRTAASAVRHYSGPRSPSARLCVNALALALAGGLGGAVVRGRVRVDVPTGADTIEAYLRSVVSPEVRVSMYLGPARANRKPVLQLISGAGETAGFAKIGVSPLTRRLVRAEHDALEQLSQARLTEITIPRVLHHGEWHGLDVLVLSALPAWRRHRPLPGARLAAAMGELAGIAGLQRAPFGAGEYLRRLRARLVAAGEGAEQTALAHVLDAMTEEAGGAALTLGAWHGDWAPWNMASTGQGLAVWDWERFTHGVPLGFDALHYWLQAAVGPGHRDPQAAAAECLQRAARLLAPFGVAATEARLTAAVYLAELAVRYLGDRQAEAGARHGDPGTWLIPALVSETARP
jgi:Phosphotransferase enzyme family